MDINLSGLLDAKIVVVLWCIGYAIKHMKWKPIKSISNTIIPVLLVGVGLIMSCLLSGDVTFNALLVGFTSAMFAIGVHASGKNIFKAFTNTTVYVTPDSLTNSTAKQVGNNNSVNGSSVEDYVPISDYPDDGVIVSDDEVIIDSGNSVG